MEAVIASLIGVVGMLITGGFVWLRSEIVQHLKGINERLDRMDARFDRVDDRFDRVDDRFDRVDDKLQSRGGKVRRLEGR